MDKASITLNISLPLGSSKEEAVKAIAAIEAFFDDGIQPKDAATVNASIATNVASAFSGVTVPVTAVEHAAITSTTDAKGLPWDERIHSSSKALNADGSWRYKKNVSPTLKAEVENALRATLGAPAPAATETAVAAPAPMPLPLPPAAPAPIAPASTAYAEFLAFITANTAPNGRIPGPEWVQQTLAAYGVADGSLQNLAHREDLIPTITAAIKTALGQ